MVPRTSWFHPNSLHLEIYFISLQNEVVVSKANRLLLIILIISNYIEWTNFANIKYKLSKAQSQLRKNKTNAKELRKQHLMQRASAMNIANKMTSSSTIINIQKIEQVIIMWNKINCLTADNKKSSLQTIDIPIDKTIKWNDIKQTQTYCSKL